MNEVHLRELLNRAKHEQPEAARAILHSLLGPLGEACSLRLPAARLALQLGMLREFEELAAILPLCRCTQQQQFAWARLLAGAAHAELQQGHLVASARLQGKANRWQALSPLPAQPQAPAYSAKVGAVLLVCSAQAPGGLEGQLVKLARALQANAGPVRSVTVLLLNNSLRMLDFFAHEFQDFSIETVRLEVDWERPLVDNRWDFLPQLWRRTVLALVDYLLRHRPAIVHSLGERCNLITGLASLAAGAPRVLLHMRTALRELVQGTVAGNPMSLAPRLYYAMAQSSTLHLFANSRRTARENAECCGLVQDKIGLLGNMVELPYGLGGEDVRARLGIPPNAPVVGAVQRLETEKRPMLWLSIAEDVARSHPETHFVVVGEGSLLPEMMARADSQSQLHGRLHLVGWQQPVWPWYECMDLLLLCSSREGLPNCLLEAQAVGLPVVASDVGGASEACQSGLTGLLVGGDRAEDFAKQVIWALRNERWRAEAAPAARLFIRENYSTQALLKATLAAYGSFGSF